MPTIAFSAEAKIAVSANFTAAAKDIAKAFQAKTGHKAVLAFGSTGKLFTQIANGAPFEAFLAADQKRPQKAEAEGLAVPGSRFTYAKGKIVLFSTDAKLVDDAGKVLGKPDAFDKLAITNPKTAPYGAAAVEAMNKLGVYAGVKSKLVKGDNLAQTYQFIVTKNAQLGFVAYSQVVNAKGGSKWVVPDNLYAPIRQDAVLLKTGENNEVAKAFLAFLKGEEAHAILKNYGYGLE
ncbi:MAG: molybdate ABC transporter substrate-binding protein [Alphaproteobacteria bacterium]